MNPRRWVMLGFTTLAVAGIIATSILAVWIDREQCKSAVQAIENTRTMWEYLIERNPGPEADAFAAEMDRRIPSAHCVGGRLVVDEAVTTPTED